MHSGEELRVYYVQCANGQSETRAFITKANRLVGTPQEWWVQPLPEASVDIVPITSCVPRDGLCEEEILPGTLIYLVEPSVEHHIETWAPRDSALRVASVYTVRACRFAEKCSRVHDILADLKHVIPSLVPKPLSIDDHLMNDQYCIARR